MKVSNVISSRTAKPAAQPRKRESSSSTERFTLSGPSAKLDPTFNAYRGDLADIALASKLFAPHYAKAAIRHGGPRVAALHSRPDAEVIGELQPGEAFALLDVTAGWAWGYRASDRLVGYLLVSALAKPD